MGYRRICGDVRLLDFSADPVIEEVLKDIPEDVTFITCTVGNREVWKDPKNTFRTDQDLKLKSVPTLIKWKTPKKLEEEQLFDKEIVSMMFEDD
ncbi:thioredoxin domain-containing protein 17-like [Centruroides sculpturatus]|uniref:thioredoxin domain-containing protein 17-like n=1 Tax=Centruroides sculpturatus TaxID=218467 RepID=UPI000C6CB672|nr:thioredoxin domain-containing protein 17-like [Centruroides sculpturatus]